MRCFRLVLLGWLLHFPLAAVAEVTRIEITDRQPYEAGKAFGETGSYERIRGKVYYAIDPLAEANQAIVDGELAPRNHEGRVEFSTDLEMLVPQDRSKANGALLYDVNNRGNRVCLGMFNGGGADGFLMRQGYIVVWSGWIAEVLPGGERLILEAPTATEGGKPITGIVRAEFVSNTQTDRANIAHFANQGSYPPTQRGLEEAKLTWRLRERDPRVAIPRAQWKLHQDYVEVDGRRSALPRLELEISGGIRSGYIYELIYEAQGPIVQGLGLAGIRDLIAFLKSEPSPRNPLSDEGRSVAKLAYGFGVSQSGRCLRQFLYDGFNADEKGRMVFDGLIPHVAGGGLGFFNHRFASPTRHNTQHDNHQYPADVFPFAYGEERDPFTERREGILSRARAANVAPKIMHVQTSSEYWHRAGSLVHTDPLGVLDAKIPPEVRIYAIGGAQHGAGSGRPSEGGSGQLPGNPTDYRPVLRGLLTALDRWVRHHESPPSSVYPTIAEGNLVPWSGGESGWRPLPGARYPDVIHQPDFVDRGPLFLTKRQITIEPPKILGHYIVKVPGYKQDNNERGCLLLPTVAVPVATFTSWNLRKREIGAETELLSLSGGYVPFAATKFDRQKTGDSRPSLQELYGNFETYRQQFEDHVRQLLEQGFLLEEDVPRLHRLAESQRVFFQELGKK
jgi:Alpha/beta hydrolase domain